MKRFVFFISLFLVFICPACTTAADNSSPDWIWSTADTTTIDSTTEPNKAIVALGWTNISSRYGALPTYINLYKAPDTLQGKKAIAYIAVADMTKATFAVLGDSAGYNYLNDLYKSTKKSIILNGGFFYNGVSLSLICRNGKVICPNNQVDSQDWNTLYYPTRGAFGLMSDGNYSTTWTYTTLAGKTYSYPEAAQNKYGSTPLETPSSTFPSGAISFSGTTAIGGGPVLIKGGMFKNTYEAELLDIEATSNQPRSAIGITSGKKMVFFVAEGRNMTVGVSGFTTADVANILLSFGCIEAMNLDGGGSSCMLVNGIETIQPSDGSDRKVVTAVALE